MAPMDSAKWMENPEDLTNILQFLYSPKSYTGQGGDFDKTVFSEAAAYMAKEFLLKAGGPKTANCIADKWKACKKLHEHFLKIKHGVYIGALGWMHTDKGGFNIMDDTLDVWDNFIKAHLHFKNFAMCRWAHFQVINEIVPSHACGHYVFNAGATQARDVSGVS
ncbi:hypothetical protein DFH08DRAFT_966955 [Mycena albidolilacea]|uniref:Uncharacterized protein n=1 Tax=Mycena albidolilacea TaxID=1033008 RepID=A0AAD6ZN44_9AGAR|nr:hypothetical protein DFH08DRAFT_966955 [Mycena albidolilacea]